MSIHTVRNSKLSLFQAMVDDLVLDHRHDDRAPTEKDRPTLDHPMVHAAAAWVKRRHAGEQPDPHAPPPEVESGAGSTAWRCVTLAGEYFLAKVERREERARQLEQELDDSTCDPRWVEAVTQYLEYFGLRGDKRSIPYVRYQELDDFVLEVLPRNARVALIADWGTGTDEARVLLEQVAAEKPDVVVHLGDIYYAGTPRETEHNFLDIVDEVLDRPASGILLYNLTGNHDMYSGGTGYYELLPKLNPSDHFPAEAAQRASYVCLRSPGGAWQLLGMDTGLHDHDPFDVTTDVTYLEDSEVTWHLDKIDRWSAAGGKTFLLSHHQLFSAYSKIGDLATKAPEEAAYNPKLLAAFREVLEDRSKRVAGWFWGHEHTLAIYDGYPPLLPHLKGRCIGHAAIPVFDTQSPYRVIDGLTDPPKLVEHGGRALELAMNADEVYDHGWVLLELDDDAGTATASYWVESEDDPLYTEVLD